MAAALAALVAAGSIANCAPLGGRATGARLQRMQKSPEWQGSHFENPQPIVNDTWAAVVSLFRPDPNAEPQSPPRTVPVEPGRFAAPPSSGLRVTWLGHSTVLLEIDGHRFLTDPMWSERVGPIGFAGPKRWFPALLALRDLPPLDAVVLSHDHYDHLDYATIVALKDRHVIFVAPLGVGAHLERWGVPAAQIVEAPLVGLALLRKPDSLGAARATRLGTHVALRRRREAMDGLCVLGRSPSCLLLRGYWALSGHANDRREVRPVRSHDDRDRPI